MIVLTVLHLCDLASDRGNWEADLRSADTQLTEV